MPEMPPKIRMAIAKVIITALFINIFNSINQKPLKTIANPHADPKTFTAVVLLNAVPITCVVSPSDHTMTNNTARTNNWSINNDNANLSLICTGANLTASKSWPKSLAHSTSLLASLIPNFFISAPLRRMATLDI